MMPLSVQTAIKLSEPITKEKFTQQFNRPMTTGNYEAIWIVMTVAVTCKRKGNSIRHRTKASSTTSILIYYFP